MSDIVNRVCHGTRTEGFCKPRNGSRMADPGTVISVVSSKAGADHFLNHINIFV